MREKREEREGETDGRGSVRERHTLRGRETHTDIERVNVLTCEF